MSLSAACSKRLTQALKAAGWLTASAWSGRKVGKTRVATPSAAIFL
jgi:hypothetical protein